MSGERFNAFRVDDLTAAVDRVGPSWADFRGASVFITGASGFLGQWLTAVLLKANDRLELGLEITVLVRSPERFLANSPDLATHPALRIAQGDVRFFEFPKGHFTHLIHAATDTSQEADKDALRLMETIVDGTRRVLAFAQTAGIRKALLTSSGAVYGPQPKDLARMSETYGGACPTEDLRSNYGQSKRLAEQLMTIYHRQFKLETRIARCFAFVGPRMNVDGHFAIGNFVRDYVRGQKLRILGDGQPRRSYLYAADAAAWLLRILADGEAGGIYNVGSDEELSIVEIAKAVVAALGGKGEVVVEGQGTDGFRSRYIPDISRARALGLDVWTPLNEAICRTAEWLREAPDPSQLPRIALHQEKAPGHENARSIVVDIDGVIASLTPGNEYHLATPLEHTIAAVNRLYDKGWRIILFTARGSATGIDWSSVTTEQLQRWNVRYHELRFGKPVGDYYVDDRLLSIGELQRFSETV